MSRLGKGRRMSTVRSFRPQHGHDLACRTPFLKNFLYDHEFQWRFVVPTPTCVQTRNSTYVSQRMKTLYNMASSPKVTAAVVLERYSTNMHYWTCRGQVSQSLSGYPQFEELYTSPFSSPFTLPLKLTRHPNKPLLRQLKLPL